MIDQILVIDCIPVTDLFLEFVLKCCYYCCHVIDLCPMFHLDSVIDSESDFCLVNDSVSECCLVIDSWSELCCPVSSYLCSYKEVLQQ